MSFRFRPRLESLENRETPTPIGPELVDPNAPPPPNDPPPPPPGDPGVTWWGPGDLTPPTGP